MPYRPHKLRGFPHLASQAAVDGFPAGEDLGRGLADLETRLQLLLEDMDAGLGAFARRIGIS